MKIIKEEIGNYIFYNTRRKNASFLYKKQKLCRLDVYVRNYERVKLYRRTTKKLVI